MLSFEVRCFGRPVCRLGTVSVLKKLKSVKNPNIRITRYTTAEKETKAHEGIFPYITLPGIVYCTRRSTVQSYVRRFSHLVLFSCPLN